MSKKTSLKRLNNLNGNSVRAKTWTQRMDEILQKKKANGMTWFSMTTIPSSDKTASIENLAKCFCTIEEFRKKGVFEKTTSQTL